MNYFIAYQMGESDPLQALSHEPGLKKWLVMYVHTGLDGFAGELIAAVTMGIEGRVVIAPEIATIFYPQAEEHDLEYLRDVTAAVIEHGEQVRREYLEANN